MLVITLLGCSACGQREKPSAEAPSGSAIPAPSEEPIPEESPAAADAPLDNLTLILFLRQEARDNEGYIAVDTSPRGTCIQGEVPNPPG